MSVKQNYFYSLLNTISGLLFPIVTFPYVARILMADGIGQVNFYLSIINYISMFAGLGIPTYAIREIARVKSNVKEMNQVAVEILLLHTFLTLLGYIVVGVVALTVAQVQVNLPLFLILSMNLFFIAIGCEWFYQGMEDFKYITIRGLIVKMLSVAFVNENRDCGLVMPKILYPNGEVQYLCKLLPTPLDLFGRRFIPFKAFQEKRNAWYEMHWSGYEKVMEVPSLSGCFMFIRTDILKRIGGFDERFFMYAEDLDLCRRIGEIARTMYYPQASVFHEYEKGSYKNRKLLRYHICSIIKYFNKWGWFIDQKRKKRNSHCIKLIEYIRN